MAQTLGAGQKKEDGVQNPTVNREAAFIKGMCSRAVEWGRIEVNNLLRIKLFAEAPIREVDTSLEEIQDLLHELSPRIADITAFAIFTGFRKENILGLKVEHITFRMPKARDYVSLIVKGGRPEKFPLSILASALLSRVIGKMASGHVFLNPKTGERYISIHKTFDKAVRKLGIEVNGTKMRFHDLRHWFATYLHDTGGVSLDTVRHLLAHRDRSTTDRYAWVSRLQLGNTLDIIPQLQTDIKMARIGKEEETTEPSLTLART